MQPAKVAKFRPVRCAPHGVKVGRRQVRQGDPGGHLHLFRSEMMGNWWDDQPVGLAGR